MEKKKNQLKNDELEQVVGGGEPVPGADIYIESDPDAHGMDDGDSGSDQEGHR